jgi:hypothetical protein
MKKIARYVMLVLAAIATSCQNKELHDPGVLPTQPEGSVVVRINWAPGLNVPTVDGMRINLFSHTEDIPDYGKDDVSATGGEVRFPPRRPQTVLSYKTFAYNYEGNNVKFVNESDSILIEATSNSLSRATYSRTFPEEPTIDQVRGDFHVGINPSYMVLETDEVQFIDVYPENAVKTYTFEIRGVNGAEFISQTRGGIAGFSASYFLANGGLSTTSSTVLFNAQANGEQNTITGSFRTFGRLDRTNNFTIEILYPSNTPGAGIVQKTWDVTGQIDDGINYHIIIDDADINIPDEGGMGETGGWEVDLNDWNDVTVPLS